MTHTPTSQLPDNNPFQTLLNGSVTANEYSPSLSRFRYFYHSFQVVAAGGATATLYGSLDGVHWVAVPNCTNVGDGALVNIQGIYRYFMAQRSNDTGALTALMFSWQGVR